MTASHKYTITSLRQSSHVPSRALLDLDGQFWGKLDKGKVLELNLFKDKEIDIEEKKAIEEEFALYENLSKVFKFLELRPRSRKEIYNRLKFKYKLDSGQISKILTYLEEQGLISDEYFARWFVEQRLASGKYGPRRIRSELISKGISTELINNELTRQTNKSELKKDLAKQAEKHFSKLKGKENIRQKLISRLLYRGFEYADVVEVVNSLIIE